MGDILLFVDDIYRLTPSIVSGRDEQEVVTVYPAEERLLHIAFFHERSQVRLAGWVVKERLQRAKRRVSLEYS